jgi:hypothetical protein
MAARKAGDRSGAASSRPYRFGWRWFRWFVLNFRIAALHHSMSDATMALQFMLIRSTWMT